MRFYSDNFHYACVMWGDNVEMSPFMTLTEDSILIVIFEASTESLTCTVHCVIMFLRSVPGGVHVFSGVRLQGL